MFGKHRFTLQQLMEKGVNVRIVANMLIEARLCGMFVEELGDLITEYIASDA